jgi:hypothetical protein
MFGHELTEYQLGAIFARLSSCDPNECWLYSGCRHPEGYALYNGKRLHRLMLENKLERALSPNMLACHTCVKHRHCVNPDHLYEGTSKDNSNDMRQHGTMYRGGGKRKLTPEQRLIVGSSSEDSYKLAARYGLDPSSIRYIKRCYRAKNPPNPETDMPAVVEPHASCCSQLS